MELKKPIRFIYKCDFQSLNGDMKIVEKIR